MARTLSLGFLLLVAAALYALSPFRAAWVLREAINAGDTATIERKVEWDRVRKNRETGVFEPI